VPDEKIAQQSKIVFDRTSLIISLNSGVLFLFSHDCDMESISDLPGNLIFIVKNLQLFQARGSKVSKFK
jgi:hypothetical protein